MLYLRNHYQIQRFAPMFSSQYFVILTLTFRSLIHSELQFVYGVRQKSIFIVMWMSSFVQFSQHHLLKIFFASLNVLGVFVENEWSIHWRVHFWIFCSIGLCASPYAYHSLHFCSFVVSFKIRKYESSDFVLLLQNCFRILDAFHFHISFRLNLSVFLVFFS